MNIKNYLVECHLQPIPVMGFTDSPMEARKLQQAFMTDHKGLVTVHLLTEHGEGGFEKHPVTEEMLASHIHLEELSSTAKSLKPVMELLERHLQGQDFAALLLLHTGWTFEAFQGNWHIQEAHEGLEVVYTARQCPFSMTVTSDNGRLPEQDDNFWVYLTLPDQKRPTFWCVKGNWQQAPH